MVILMPFLDFLWLAEKRVLCFFVLKIFFSVQIGRPNIIFHLALTLYTVYI